MTHSVHIKIADQGWILEKCAREIADRANNITYGLDVNPSADIQYYVNYSCYRERVSPTEVGYFTHIEPFKEAKQRFFDVAREVDFCVSHAKRYANALRDEGIENVVDIPPGVNLDEFKPIVKIGVVGRTYHTGRKGEKLVAQVMDVPGIEWHFTGSGWPGQARMIPDEGMAAFYNDLDFVLVPALYEGGPMSVAESLACGVPVIASDVGWVNEFPHIPFETGDAASLRAVLEKLVHERYELRKSVEHITWKNWAESHIALFEKLGPRATSVSMPAAANDVVARPNQKTMVILSHGTEAKNKGGPTSRIANIQAAADKVGVSVQHFYETDLLEQENKDDLVTHVFNSWPLKTSVEAISKARKMSSGVVYSPIALNLSHVKYFQETIPNLLANLHNAEQLEKSIGQLWKLTKEWDPKTGMAPIEGVPGHYQALRLGCSTADHVIYLSEYEQAFIESLGMTPKNSSVIENGVDAQVMAEGDPKLFENTFGVSNYLLMVGRIESRKNQALTAFALRNLDVPLVCIGHVGDANYFKLLKRWAGPNFIHIDRLEDRKLLASAYKAARGLLLTSWSEGAPLVALEAASAGTPLLLSTMASEREYFGDDASYVHPCDLKRIEQVARAMIEQPESDGSRQQRSARAVAKYDISIHAAKTLEVYGSIETKDIPAAAMNDDNIIYIEATHLAHQIANKAILTGVAKVEYDIIKNLLETQGTYQIVIWNSAIRQYLLTDFETITDYAKASVANLPVEADQTFNFPHLGSVDVTLPDAAYDGELPKEAGQPMGVKRALFSIFKQSMNALPLPVKNSVEMRIKKKRPEFNSYVQPEHRVFKTRRNAKATDGHDNVKFHPSYRQVAAQSHSQVISGAKLLMFGHPWISNDRQLEDLKSFVNDNKLKLTCLINDILYVTDPEAFPTETRRTYKARLHKLLEFSKGVLVSSKAVENDMKRLITRGRLKAKVARINFGVTDTLTAVDPVAPKFSVPEKFIFYVSSMNNRKRHDYLCDVWSDVYQELQNNPLLKDVKLLLIGRPQGGYEKYGDADYLAKLAKNNIQVVSGVSDAELAWIYKNCLFCVYPSRSEGWGLPPLESLAFGKPCVVSDTIPSVGTVTNPGLIQLPTDDYFSWVNKIQDLIENEEMRKVLCEQAEKFEISDWQQTAADIVDYLQK